jgi:N-acetylneuraminate synthase
MLEATRQRTRTKQEEVKTELIAEAGINHGGSVDVACKLADAAKAAGCDYVKIQKRDPYWSYSADELAVHCLSPWGTTVEEKVIGRELSWSAVDLFNAHCCEIGIGWFASCFDLQSLRDLHARYPQRPYNKVPSVLATRREYLEAVAFQGLPALVSTGHFASVTEAVILICDVFQRFGCRFGLLHTTALYPAPVARLNLRRMAELDRAARTYMAEDGRDASLYIGAGYSGHETGVATSVVAAALGARWIERHVTLDRASYGADQAASLEPEGIRRLVRDIRSVGEALGESDPALVGDEKYPVKFWREE